MRGGGKGGGDEQVLAVQGCVCELVLELLVEDALVRGVHVYDDHAAGVFSQYVDAVDLRHSMA